MTKREDKLERVANIARQIFNVTKKAFSQAQSICCPHGNCPSYPTHAWWCDDCWNEMKDALQDLDNGNILVIHYENQGAGVSACGIRPAWSSSSWDAVQCEDCLAFAPD